VVLRWKVYRSIIFLGVVSGGSDGIRGSMRGGDVNVGRGFNPVLGLGHSSYEVFISTCILILIRELD